jgi:hypothetical protein
VRIVKWNLPAKLHLQYVNRIQQEIEAQAKARLEAEQAAKDAAEKTDAPADETPKQKETQP